MRRSHPLHRTMNGASAAKPPYSENALLSRAAPGACARARCLPEHASKARHFSGSPWPRRNFSAVLAVEGAWIVTATREAVYVPAEPRDVGHCPVVAPTGYWDRFWVTCDR